jgi:hypothetical protein
MEICFSEGSKYPEKIPGGYIMRTYILHVDFSEPISLDLPILSRFFCESGTCVRQVLGLWLFLPFMPSCKSVR